MVELAYTGENAVMMSYLDEDGSSIRFTNSYVRNTYKLPKDKLRISQLVMIHKDILCFLPLDAIRHVSSASFFITKCINCICS